MTKEKRIAAAVVLILLVLGGAYYFVRDGQGKNTGESKAVPDSQSVAMAPEFTLEGLDGQEVRLSDLRGKKVLINFWTTWCQYCREEMPLLQKFHEQSGGKNWQVLTINITSTERDLSRVKSYIESNGYTFTVLLDRTGSVSALYGIRSIPTSFMLNEKGEITGVKTGPFTEVELNSLLK
ncbi:MAG: TlpA disulfide reductase family protein [Bacillota bacterium]